MPLWAMVAPGDTLQDFPVPKNLTPEDDPGVVGHFTLSLTG